MWKPWSWRPTSQAVALRNARHAAALLAQKRQEREVVEQFLSLHHSSRDESLGA